MAAKATYAADGGRVLTQLEHCLHRPDTYIGSAATGLSDVRIFDGKRVVTRYGALHNPGLLHIFSEITCNAVDHVTRCKEAAIAAEAAETSAAGKKRARDKCLVTRIIVTVDRKTKSISVENDGIPIPVRKQAYQITDPQTNKTIERIEYPAELYFGSLHAGTNFNDDVERRVAGRNGVGAALTNFYSSEFVVDHSDPTAGARFQQTFRNNSRERGEPKITPYGKTARAYTRITFIPDLEYFGHPTAFSNDAFTGAIWLQAYEIAMISKLPVHFSISGVAEESASAAASMASPSPLVTCKISVRDLLEFARIFYPKEKAAHLTAPTNDECVIVDTSTTPRPAPAKGSGGDDDNEDADGTASGELPDIAIEPTTVSFVNGNHCANGGIHTKKWAATVVGSFTRAFNASGGAGASAGVKASARDVHPYLHFFVRADVDRPRFASQTKDRLTEVHDASGKSVPYELAPASVCTPAMRTAFQKTVNDTAKVIAKFPFARALVDKLTFKASRAVNTEPKPASNKRLNFGDSVSEANFAGTKRAKECTLFVTEGLSAKAFAMRGISSQDNGHDYMGAFAIRGKFPSITKNAHLLKSNKEIQVLCKILNLTPGANYEDDAVFATLRYGRVSILADADDDGIHIRSLLLNFFHEAYPTLIARGYIVSLSTAVVVTGQPPKRRAGAAASAGSRLFFYNDAEFKRATQRALEAGKPIKGPVHFYKGLGAVPPADTALYFDSPKNLFYKPSDVCAEAMEMCFGKSTIARKVWFEEALKAPDSKSEEANGAGRTIENGAVVIVEGASADGTAVIPEEAPVDSIIADFQYEGEITLRRFVYEQVIIYAQTAVRRAIPAFTDGLKECHRKIFYTFMARNFTTQRDLERVAGAIKEHSGYHHGSAALQDAIRGQAQGFVGSNNVPMLTADSEFGTRAQMGADAASPRYISTAPEPVMRTVFCAADQALCKYRVEDGKKVEPETYFPVVPIVLINGAAGIGMAFASTIPAYNPRDIAEWIRAWLAERDLEEGSSKAATRSAGPSASAKPRRRKRPSAAAASKAKALAKRRGKWLSPWYRGYEGTIDLVYGKDGEEEPPVGWTSRGKLAPWTGPGAKKGWWEVTEGPVGLPLDAITEWVTFLQTGDPPPSAKKKGDLQSKWKRAKDSPLAIHEASFHTSATNVLIRFRPSKDFLPDIDTKGNFDILKSSASLRNMNLQMPNGTVRNFASAEALLEQWCPWRLVKYGERMLHQIGELRLTVTRLEARLRFVRLVIEGDVKLNVQDIDDVLDKLDFPRLSSTATPQTTDVAAVDGVEDDAVVPGASHAYLLDMPMRSMTAKKIDSLTAELTKARTELDRLTKSTPSNEWRLDLTNFLAAVEKLEKRRGAE